MSTLVFGLIHDEGEDEDYNGFNYRKSELPQVREHLLGSAVLLDHDPEKVVGRVVDVQIRPSGKLAATLLIKEDTSHGPEVVRGLESGFLKGLSIGQTNLERRKNDRSPIVVSHLRPYEVSVCEEGAREGTFVTSYYRNGMYRYFESSIARLSKEDTNYNKMEPQPPQLSQAEYAEFQKYKQLETQFREKHGGNSFDGFLVEQMKNAESVQQRRQQQAQEARQMLASEDVLGYYADFDPDEAAKEMEFLDKHVDQVPTLIRTMVQASVSSKKKAESFKEAEARYLQSIEDMKKENEQLKSQLATTHTVAAENPSGSGVMFSVNASTTDFGAALRKRKADQMSQTEQPATKMAPVNENRIISSVEAYKNLLASVNPRRL